MESTAKQTVFVLQSYGNFEVRRADTIQEIEVIFETFVDSILTWGIDEDIEVYSLMMSKAKTVKDARLTLAKFVEYLAEDAGEFIESYSFAEVQ